MSHEFRDPKLAINKVYTRQGDAGETRLVGGQTIHKSHIRLETYGTVDELNGHVGLAIEFACSELAEPHKSQLSTLLRRIQHELFNLGSVLATLPEDVGPQQPKVTTYDIERLEREMDEMGAALPPLRSFVLPGGTTTGAQLHVCRTVCRRAERQLAAWSQQDDPHALGYLNRLSDAFFVWSRWVTHTSGQPEVLWDPNATR